MTSSSSSIDMLQPLRDLAMNWDVDIATCLEEYLNDLLQQQTTQSSQTQSQNPTTHDEINPSTAAGSTNTNMNFVEAALLLQNAGSVYSRKVEYLYREVYKTLQHLHSSSSSSRGTSVNSSNSSSSSSSYDKRMEENDLDPYGTFPLLDDVIVRMGMMAEEETSKTTYGYGTPVLHVVTTKSNNNNSITPIPVMGSGSGASSCAYNTHSNNKWIPSADGTLLASGGLGCLQNGILLLHDNDDVNDDGMMLLQDEQQQQGTVEVEYDGVDVDVGTYANDDHDDDDDEDGMLYNTGTALTSPHTTGMSSYEVPGAAVAGAGAKKNPWSMLDAHSTSVSTKPRPLKVGNCYLERGTNASNSPSAMSSTKRKRTYSISRSSSNSTIEVPLLCQGTSAGYYIGTLVPPDTNLVQSTTTCSRSTSSAMMTEFRYIAKSTARRLRQQQRMRSIGIGSALDNGSERYDDIVGYDNNYADDDDDDDDDGIYDIGSTSMSASIVPDTLPIHAPAPLLTQVQHRNASITSTSTLLHRVDTWQAKLAPILEAEELRPVFDIHQYGTSLLHTATTSSTSGCTNKSMKDKHSKNGNNLTSFQVLCDSLEGYDVPRYFLASLMLANSGCVRFSTIHNDNDDEKVDENELDELYVEVLSGEYVTPFIGSSSIVQ